MKVSNLTRDWTETIVNDTVFTLTNHVGINDFENNSFGLELGASNSSEGKAEVLLSVSEAGNVNFELYDISGRKLASSNENLSVGTHSFLIEMQKSQVCFLRAISKNGTASIKMLSLGNGSKNTIAYKSLSDKKLSLKHESVNYFEAGDSMQYVGYTTYKDSVYSSELITKSQMSGEELTLMFDICYVITNEFSETACDSYIWNETEYTVSGDYEQTFTAANGCDSVVTLHLTIRNAREEITVNGVTFTMIGVDGGSFYMGAQSTDSTAQNYYANVEANESPVHQVTLDDYYIGETEVTQALWYAVMGQRPISDGNQWSETNGLGDNYPAYLISWNDIQNFIIALNDSTGLTFRMPTEAEWEYAARGGNQSNGYIYSGSNTIGDVAWYGYYSTPQGTATSLSTCQVKTKSANELGIYDMSGNVWEWCSDLYGAYGTETQINPTGHEFGSYRVIRGGGWGVAASICRVSYRYFYSPTDHSDHIGFRLALVQ